MTKKTRILLITYVGAALVALSVFSAVCWGHLRLYRRQTGYDAARAFGLFVQFAAELVSNYDADCRQNESGGANY